MLNSRSDTTSVAILRPGRLTVNEVSESTVLVEEFDAFVAMAYNSGLGSLIRTSQVDGMIS